MHELVKQGSQQFTAGGMLPHIENDCISDIFSDDEGGAFDASRQGLKIKLQECQQYSSFKQPHSGAFFAQNPSVFG